MEDSETENITTEIQRDIFEETSDIGKSYIDFRNAVGDRESTDNYQAINSSGFMGRYQMGNMALREIEFLDENNNWTDKAQAFGISSKNDFLNNEEAQDKAFDLLVQVNLRYIKNYKLDSYIGQTMNGVVITESGLLGGVHLVGINGMVNALRKGDLTSVKDGNGVTAKEYVEEFGGYEIEKEE